MRFTANKIITHIQIVKLLHELYASVNLSIIAFRTNKNTPKHPKLTAFEDIPCE